MTGTIRIAVWSGPRNISTAMMRAWENRGDTSVMDEPFYGCYLAETGKPHPMRAEILAAEPILWNEAEAQCAADTRDAIVYQKHMCQHMVPQAPLGWCRTARHAFLIRPPEEVAVSFQKGFPDLVAEDLGFHRQAELFEEITAMTGRVPPVIAARTVQEAPEAALRALCAALEVPFDPAMLSWPKGGRDSDGVWADHWYAAVCDSTGFAPWKPSTSPGPELAAIIEACRVPYETMRRHAIEI